MLNREVVDIHFRPRRAVVDVCRFVSHCGTGCWLTLRSPQTKNAPGQEVALFAGLLLIFLSDIFRMLAWALTAITERISCAAISAVDAFASASFRSNSSSFGVQGLPRFLPIGCALTSDEL